MNQAKVLEIAESVRHHAASPECQIEILEGLRDIAQKQIDDDQAHRASRQDNQVFRGYYGIGLSALNDLYTKVRNCNSRIEELRAQLK